jgi:hypothetical protein
MDDLTSRLLALESFLPRLVEAPTTSSRRASHQVADVAFGDPIALHDQARDGVLQQLIEGRFRNGRLHGRVHS